MRSLLLSSAVLLAVLLAGCEQLGIESAEKTAASRDADGKAVGAACRHSGRAIEDCYVIYKKVDRAAIFAGWRDMNDYMRENKIEPVPPQLNPAASAPKAGPAKRPAVTADAAAEPPSKPAAEDRAGAAAD